MCNLHSTILAISVATLLCAGCKNQQGSAPNPFMSADRVPPPATRTPAPGTATPYYPNDPLPAMPPNASTPPAAFPADQFAQTTTPTEGAIALPTDQQPVRIAYTPP